MSKKTTDSYLKTKVNLILTEAMSLARPKPQPVF